MSGQETKTFSVPDVISAVCGVLVSERHMDAVYEVLSFLHGRSLFTHELPQAMDPALKWVAADYPWLATLDTSGVTPSTWREWTARVVAEHPEPITLTPISWSALRELSPLDTIPEHLKEGTIVLTIP